MSLINRLLHDLEDRSALAAAAPSVISDLRSAQDYAEQERRLHSRLMMVIAGIAVLVFAGLLIERGVEFSGTAPARDSAAVMSAPAAGATRAEQVTPPPAVSAGPKAADENPALALKLDTVILSAAPNATTAARDHAGVTDAVPTALTAITHQGSAQGSNIHLDLTSAPDYRLYILQNPNRLLLQSSHFDFAPGVIEGFQPGGLINGIRYAHQGGITKLIFDLNAPALIEDSSLGELSPQDWELSIALAPLGRPVVQTVPAELPLSFPTEPADMEATVAPPMQKTLRGASREEEEQTLFARGMDAYRLGDVNGAASVFRQMLKAYPEHLRARRMLASILTANKDFEGAKTLLADGLQHHPGEPSLAKSYATLLLDEGREAEALEVLGRTWPAVAADPEYYALAAAIYQRQANHVEAATIYRRLLETNPGKGLWWTGLAISLEALGSPRDALDSYRQARRDRTISADVARYIEQRIIALAGAPT